MPQKISKSTYEDFKVNKRCFARYLKKEKLVIRKSRIFQKLPKQVEIRSDDVYEKGGGKRKKKTGYSSMSDDSPVKPKLKKRCVVGEDTTDEDL